MLANDCGAALSTMPVIPPDALRSAVPLLGFPPSLSGHHSHASHKVQCPLRPSVVKLQQHRRPLFFFYRFHSVSHCHLN